MSQFYHNYPLFVYKLRNWLISFLARSNGLNLFLQKCLKSLGNVGSLYSMYTYVQRTTGLYSVLRPTDVAVQAGISTDTPWSQAFDIARILKKGTLVAVEPDPRNIKVLKTRFRGFDADVRLVPKATSDKGKKIRLFLGKNKSWTRVPAPWKSYRKVRFEKDQYETQAESIDNILKEQKIAFEDVAYVNITNNGAEYETLKGMQQLLIKSRNICISVIAGARGNTDALIDGRPDEEVIMEFLKKHGFRVRFRGFHQPGRGFGYVIGVKGNKPFLM